MLSKAQIKYINSLKIKKIRQKTKAFIAEGEKVAGEILNSEIKIQHIYALQEWAEQHSFLKEKNLTVISEDELKKISTLNTPNKVLIVAEIPEYSIIPTEIKNGLTLILDNIGDPGNLGTIIRIADWFGITNIFCSPDCVDTYNTKVIQATMGSIARVKIFYTELSDLFKQFEKLPVYGAMLEGENINEADLQDKGFIVIGSESKGISSSLLSFITQKITIPAFGKAESLNASVAAGIICAAFKKK